MDSKEMMSRAQKEVDFLFQAVVSQSAVMVATAAGEKFDAKSMPTEVSAEVDKFLDMLASINMVMLKTVASLILMREAHDKLKSQLDTAKATEVESSKPITGEAAAAFEDLIKRMGKGPSVH